MIIWKTMRLHKLSEKYVPAQKRPIDSIMVAYERSVLHQITEGEAIVIRLNPAHQICTEKEKDYKRFSI